MKMNLIKNNNLIFVVGIFLGVILVSCESKPKEVKKPNVLIILADDAGYSDFGFMGTKDLKTPHIDQIAKNGVVFTDAHTTGSVCSPSRAGLLTGRYQQRFGHENNSPPKGFGIDPAETTIADVLKSNGYVTSIFGKWHLGDTKEFHPNNRGFDEFYGFLGGHRHYFPNPKDDKPGAGTAVQHNGMYTTFEGYYTYVLGNKVIDFIEENKSKPFFSFLSFNAVHTPMEATEEDMKLFQGHPRQKLAAMTYAMDKAVGSIMDKLKKEGLLENTIVFFLSDNGGPTNSNQSSNLPLKGTKGYEFEGGHRVPFVVQYGDKLKKGTKFEGLTSTMDIFSTVLALIDNKYHIEKPLDGVDLLPFLKGEKKGNPHDELFWRIGPWTAARKGTYKLISAKELDTALYDLAKEINEKTNLKEKDTTIFKTMVQSLIDWEQELENPDWEGSKAWLEYKKYMYQDLIDDIPPRFKNMGALRKYLEKQKESEKISN